MSTSTAQTEQQQYKTGVNGWKFSGKVIKKDFKYSAKGNFAGSFMLKVPAKNEKYSTVLWIKAFNQVAEDINEKVKEDGNYMFFGYVQNSNYEKDGQRVYRNDFVATKFFDAIEEEPVATK